jgi:hypothetical protein
VLQQRVGGWGTAGMRNLLKGDFQHVVWKVPLHRIIRILHISHISRPSPAYRPHLTTSTARSSVSKPISSQILLS